jgi:uridine kinase
VLLDWLAGEIRRRKSADRPLKVGIDGRCASGKTYLADSLAPRLRACGFEVLRPSVDGFHHPKAYRYRKGEYSAIGYYEDAFDYAAVVSHLLQPLSGSTFPVTCRRASHDVRTDVAVDDPVAVSGDAVLLFDGLFLFRPELNAYWDFRVLLHVDPATSVSRAVERDQGPDASADVVRRKYDVRYEPAWLMYCELESPDSKADVVIDNTDVQGPVILKRPRSDSGESR